MYDERYLKLLSVQYPNAEQASLEIIRLSSMLDLPKGTEHFVRIFTGKPIPFYTC